MKNFLDEVQIQELLKRNIINEIKDISENDLLKLIPNTLPKSKVKFSINYFVFFWRCGYYNEDIQILFTEGPELIDCLFGIVVELKNQKFI